ncbi:uncharacterized protein LOC126366084 isoform X2 [Pectinophora gossypiella]|uniref:uncharacterized protein LOC126366084 isoform X2 n=1 Tax=Pectinophora gossypiella TaxID=13191 RepID=UPI00214EA1BB|nr:uncharacterized protein LOC126366084 isoform X2 [Pectinophora gossypiella]
MKPSTKQIKSFCSLLVLVLQTSYASGGSQFSSHVTVNTPTRSYSHGVGDPIPAGRRAYQSPLQRPGLRYGRRPQNQGNGYPRIKPTIPFNNEERPASNFNISPWQQNSFQEVPIPVLPPSPYKVDSPDPESLWPEGLFLPPLRPYTFAANRRSDSGQDQIPWIHTY